jgi:hypothetical protein
LCRRCAWAPTIAPAPFRNRQRLLRYCARPPFALERLELLDADHVVYRLPKPQGDGTAALTPLELIDHLAALIPPPRRHRHRRALAPNAPLRAVAIAFGREVAEATDSPTAVSPPPPTPASNARSPARYLWVMLPDGIKLRLFESLPLNLSQLRRRHAPDCIHHRGRARRADSYPHR